MVKAPGLDELTAEYLKYAHPAIALVLTKLFNLMLKCDIVPDSVGRSYSVPIPKGNCSRGKSVTFDDFRAISICPVISKVFELGVLDQFKVVDSYTSNGSTVNTCSLDLSKAFDKTNHNALLIKLMNRNIPEKLLSIIKNWLNKFVSDGVLHSQTFFAFLLVFDKVAFYHLHCLQFTLTIY